MKTILVSLVGLVVAMAAACQSAQSAVPPAVPEPGSDGGYTLNLKRPWAGGDSYTLSLALEVHAEGGSGQDVQFWSSRNKDQHIAFLGKVRVIDVTLNGEGKTLMVKVEKAGVTEKGKSRALKVEGSELGVSFIFGQVNFVLKDGQPIPPEDLEVLKQVFQPPKDVSEADYLSPGRAVRPGEQWGMNREALLKAIAPQSATGGTAPEVTEASVHFVGPETVDGADFLHLVERLSFKTGDTDRFYGTKVTQVKEDLYIPRDPASKAMRRTTEVIGRVNGRVRNAENQLLEVKGLTKVTRKVDIKAG
jgi:hypothetical protein